MTKKKLLVIINPVSGTGRQKKAETLLLAGIDPERFEMKISFTAHHRHAIELSKEAVASNYDAVVIVGGDGSVNEVGQSLAGTGVAMGIIPAGSGNGLSRALSIPMKIEKAVKVINDFNFRTIDTGTVNGKPFMNVAGVGLDAYVADKFHKAKLRGIWKYILLIIRSLTEYTLQEYEVKTTEGPVFKRRAYLIALANSPQYGNEALLAPMAKMDDGELNCVVLNPFPFPVIFVLLYQLFRGTLHTSKYIKTFSFKSMVIKQERNDVMHLDGDPYHLGVDLAIEIKKESLKVIVPEIKIDG